MMISRRVALNTLVSGPAPLALRNQIDLLRPKLPTTFGSAEWATAMDFRRAGRLVSGTGKNLGPLLGCLTPAEIGGRTILNFFAPGQGHLASIAPTATGKSRGQVITNLLWYPGSVVVLDIKGELYERTAGWRQANGHRVIKYAPFERGSARWNPLDALNDGCGNAANEPRRQENARYLTNLMITPNPQAKDPYWDKAAGSLMQNLMTFVATAPLDDTVRERTMGQVYRLLAEQDPAGFKSVLAAMAKSPEDWVRQGACTMLHMEAAREQSASVKTVLLEHMKIWALQRVQEATAATDFSFKDLRDATPTTIYLIIPPDEIAEYRVLLRVMIGWCVRALRQSWSETRDDARPPVMLLLDEFPQLHFMEPIQDSLLFIRSYGVKYWFFAQTLCDLQRHYPDTWRSFIANCGTSFYGVSDIETAKLVSEMSGTATVINRTYQAGVNDSHTVSDSVTSGSGGSSGCGPGGSNSSSTYSSGRTFTTGRTVGSSFSTTLAHTGRPLCMPDEVLRMPFGSLISFSKGMPPMRGQLRFWDEDPELRRRGMMLPPSA
jgi:type IV secretion system protein VirD4